MAQRSDSPYRIFGLDLSPYSLKVRAAFRFKRIPHEWIPRSSRSDAEFLERARLPLVPLVITPDDEALQDSTPILERLEEWAPEPSFHPPSPTLAFLSALVEEYADEWVNKHMFHHRWTNDADRRLSAERLAAAMLPDAADAQVADAARGIIERMLGRLHFVGSNPVSGPVIEASYRRMVEILEAHLASRRFLFGASPAFADFGLGPELYECSVDVVTGGVLRERGPHVAVWAERMLDPRAGAGFESWKALAPTLEPLLRDEVAGHFLPWSDANARALAAGEKEFEVELASGLFRQQVQKYHARSLNSLRARYAAAAGNAELDDILERSGCLAFLRPS